MRSAGRGERAHKISVREIVEAHYATLDAAGDEPITVRPAEGDRALAQVARRERPAAA
ncbi:hypothetical protein GA0070608_0029 [Micromonospora peucetia]|uniref:Uncharacterized protein n=1 Tax=Micromonospora peucetia TaxID=47871 RepID=A0A1C6TUT3_9ACTN|nr:hypothetical protein GA0070608_0029 [Micromonospora peucetia]